MGKVMKLLNSFLLASATAGTCEISPGGQGCSGGPKWEPTFLRKISGQTTDTCKDLCLEDEKCSEFIIAGTACYLFSGECDRKKAGSKYYKCSKEETPAEQTCPENMPFNFQDSYMCCALQPDAGGQGCSVGPKWESTFLRKISGQTTDTCKDLCLEDEKCSEFIISSSSCYLFSGECDRATSFFSKYYKCSKGDADPCDAKGCAGGCTNTDGTAVCDCSTKPLLILGDDGTSCVQQCTVKNGGCDASAVCTNPTQAH